MTIALDHVQLAMPAGKEDVARAFWCGIVGLEEIEKPTALAPRGGIWLRLSGSELHLGVQPAFQPAQKAHPGFCVSEIAELAERLEHAGTAITWDDTIEGRRRFFAQDPFGNRLEFLQPSSSTG